jgi:hypothetical protein
MVVHHRIHLAIAREGHRDLLARAERRRIAKAALAGRQEDRGRSLIEAPALHEPSPTTMARRPQRANA